MASRLDRLIREHAERLDRLAGPIELTDVTSVAPHGATTVELVDVEPGWTQPKGRHRRSVIVVAAAAVVAVGVGGLLIAMRSDDPTGEVPADQLTTVAPNTAVAPRRETGVFEGSEQDGFGPGVTYTVPDGWENIGYGVTRDPTVAVVFLGADDPHFTNFCRSTSGRTIADPVGPTVQNLVSAWSNLPGVDATAARNVTVDGFKGMQIEFTVPDYSEGDCNGLYNRCGLPVSEPNQPIRCVSLVGSGSTSDTPYRQALPNQHQKVWVLDVDGTRVMIMAGSFPEASQQDRAALDEIVASVDIG